MRRLRERIAGPYRGLDQRVFSLMLCNLLFLGARLAVLTFLAIYFVRERGLPAPLVGVAFLVENVVRALLAPLAGALSDRIGRAPLLVASAGVTAVLMPALLLVNDPLGLILWSVAVGMGQAPFFPVATALLIDLVPVERRQRAFALNYTGLSLGYTLAILPAGFLAERDFTLLALASGATFLLIPVVALVALRGAGVQANRGGATGVLAGAVRAFRDRAFVGFTLLAIALPLSLATISFVLPLYAADAGVPTRDIGLILAASGVVILFVAVPLNAAFERFGPLRVLPYTAGVVAAAYAGIASAPHSLGLLVAVVVYSLAEVIFMAALPTAVGALAPPDARGSYQGAWGMAFTLAVGSAFFLGGIGRDTIGWTLTWVTLMVLTLGAGAGLAVFGDRLASTTSARVAAASAERAKA